MFASGMCSVCNYQILVNNSDINLFMERVWWVWCVWRKCTLYWGGKTCLITSVSKSASIEDFLDAAKKWVHQGVQVVGTCCGFGVEYIRDIREVIPKSINHKRLRPQKSW